MEKTDQNGNTDLEIVAFMVAVLWDINGIHKFKGDFFGGKKILKIRVSQ